MGYNEGFFRSAYMSNIQRGHCRIKPQMYSCTDLITSILWHAHSNWRVFSLIVLLLQRTFILPIDDLSVIIELSQHSNRLQLTRTQRVTNLFKQCRTLYNKICYCQNVHVELSIDRQGIARHATKQIYQAFLSIVIAISVISLKAALIILILEFVPISFVAAAQHVVDNTNRRYRAVFPK